MKTIILKPGREKSIYRQHPWLFSGGIAKLPEGIADGDEVMICDHTGESLAGGFYSPSSISVRVFSFQAELPSADLLKKKLISAYELRQQLGFIDSEITNAFRLVHGEGDGLPGTIIDIYHDAAVIQCHHAGIYKWRETLAQLVIDLFKGKIHAVYSKSDRILKHTEKQDGWLLGEHADRFSILENSKTFIVDVREGQKTGFFLDQRDNRLLLSEYAQNKDVLNTFCYSGGFSVFAAAGGAHSVCSVDSSAHAIELAKGNMHLNDFKDQSYECVDAVDFIGQTKDQYDVIVLDPPAFAKHLSAQKQALKGYRRINQQAIKNIRKNGLLFTYSCSQAVSAEMFESVIMAASVDAKRNVRVLKRMGHPTDHPVSIYHPEGEYLKGLMLHIE